MPKATRVSNGKKDAAKETSVAQPATQPEPPQFSTQAAPNPDEEQKVPAWASGTPEETQTDYDLIMYDHRHGGLQEISLEREEFIWVKELLAARRGYGYSDQLTAILAANPDTQQAAFLLEDARQILRDYPALVLGPEMPQGFEDLCRPEEATSHA